MGKDAKAANFSPIPLRMKFRWMVRTGNDLRRMLTCRDLAISLGYADGFATGAGCERRHDRIGKVAQEPHRSIREREICPAGMEGPEVVSVAGIIDSTRPEAKSPRARIPDNSTSVGIHSLIRAVQPSKECARRD